MTDAQNARLSLDKAQELLEQVEGDHAKIQEFVTWLGEANARTRELDTYYRGQVESDFEAVNADEPGAVTPRVADQDSAWEALVSYEEQMLRLLRVVATHLSDRVE